jgi:hypothetical protein
MPTERDFLHLAEKPRYRRTTGRPPLYPFRKLKEIGDCLQFLIEDAPKVRASASNYKARNPGWNYASETVETGDGPRLRLTRIKPLTENQE